MLSLRRGSQSGISEPDQDKEGEPRKGTIPGVKWDVESHYGEGRVAWHWVKRLQSIRRASLKRGSLCMGVST